MQSSEIVAIIKAFKCLNVEELSMSNLTAVDRAASAQSSASQKERWRREWEDENGITKK